MTDKSDSWLLTPGPLTTSMSVKQVMLHDWGSRDKEFIRVNQAICEKLVGIANVQQTHVCVPIQGSGTFTVEATVGTLLGQNDKALVLVNGAYGKRICRICEYHDRAYIALETPEDVPNDLQALDQMLNAQDDITHVIAIHCETTSGILNPIEKIAALTARHKRKLIIDAMSAFGALPLDGQQSAFDALVASSNKCLEGVPGLGFAILKRDTLEQCKGHSPALSLDLYDQWRAMQANGQWRFTPPTHVLMALHQAILEHETEGGVAGRGDRYRNNCRILVNGMRKLGFITLLPDNLQAPIIVTFHIPGDPNFNFQMFYDRLSDKGFVIYPGKLTVANSFRIGCIGRLGEEQIHGALDAIRTTLAEMSVSNCAPAKVA